MPRFVQKYRPPDDKNPLQGLLDYENLDEAVIAAGGQIHDFITQLRDGVIQWIKETTGIDLSGLAEFSDAITAALAQALNLGEGGGAVLQLLKDLITLDPKNFLARLAGLFGGDPDLELPDIFDGLNSMFGGLRSDGGLDAGKLFGDLPEDLVNGLRGLISAVLDPSWLANIMPGQIGTGWSENLLTNPLFDGAISLISDAGWEHDSVVFPSGAKGSAKVVADGTRKVLSNKIIKGSQGQTFRSGGEVEWSGPAATVGRAFTVELRPFNAAGVELAPIDVAGINNAAASSAGAFQQILADLPWPAGAAWIKMRIAVESTVPVGTVVRWSNLQARKGGFMPQDRVSGLPDDLADLFGNFFGLGNALDGFLRGSGTPSTGGPADPILDWVRDALGQFTGQTNTTATTADQAHGVGSNALTNTVAIQAQVQSLADVQDAGWTARPLWASMDYTADSTFPLYLMQRNTAHAHTGTSTLSGGSTNSQGSSFENISGTTGNTTAGGDSHNHSFSDSFSWSHTHTVSGTVSTTVASANAEFSAYTFTSSQAYAGFIRCGSVQEKRLFSFRGYYSAAPSDFRLDIYRMAKSGVMTLLHTSANLAGALTASAQWIQYVIPSGTAGINVQPGDILAVQFRTTSGTVALQGIDSLIPSNPPGFLPRRVGMLRTGTITAPATMAESDWSAGVGFVPYIEAGIDTGQASAPLSISDNFDGSLSQQWLMTGANEIGIASNNIGIIRSGTDLADGWSWGKFNTQLRTDQAKVGLFVTATSAEEQVVWFKGNGPSSHVGLSVTSSYATLYTMLGGTRTNRASIAVGTVDAAYEIRYDATSKVFSVWRNGSQIGSWTDSGNVAPTGLGNRFGGVGLHATRGAWFGIGSTKANPIDNWLLADVA